MSTIFRFDPAGKMPRRHGPGSLAAALLVTAAVLLPATGRAAVPGVGIHVLKEQYMTDLRVEERNDTGAVEASRKTTSGKPVSDELQLSSERIKAKAKADTFSVYTDTEAALVGDIDQPLAKATAQTVLNFRPAQDARVPLAFEFAGSSLVFYSSGFVSLFDLTANESVFSYSWACCRFQGTVPWEYRGIEDWAFGASLAPAPDLLASHEYALTLNASTNASLDGQYLRIDVSGVYAVPEPEAFAMMLAGLGLVGGIAGSRRRAKGRRRLATAAL